jgi:hypothetical protein
MNSEPKDVTVADLHIAPAPHADPTVRVIKGFLSGERPPADKVMIGTWTPIAFAELRALRASVRHALAIWLMPVGAGSEEVARRLAIVATELAANAMAHTGPPTTVRLFRTDTTYIVEVADNNPWLVAQGNGSPEPVDSVCAWPADCPCAWAGTTTPASSTYGPRSPSRWRRRGAVLTRLRETARPADRPVRAPLPAAGPRAPRPGRPSRHAPRTELRPCACHHPPGR